MAGSTAKNEAWPRATAKSEMFNLEFYKEGKKKEESKLITLNDKNFVSCFQFLISVFLGFLGDSLCNRTGFCTPADGKKIRSPEFGSKAPKDQVGKAGPKMQLFMKGLIS